MKKICHLTSVHERNDTRIFLKECQSLASAGYKVFLIVADGQGDDLINTILVYDVGSPKNRLSRILKTTRRIYKKALAIDADIYHLHDPELIPIGLQLLKKGKKVIFDAHEDFSKQLLSKPYLNRWQKVFLSHIARVYERYSLKKITAVIAATPGIGEKFLLVNDNTVVVNNFPILGELYIKKNELNNLNGKKVCYVGSITEIRGIFQIVKSLENIKSDITLDLVGHILPLSLKEKLKKTKGWNRVNELGFLDRDGIRSVLSNSTAGLVLFLPVPNHINSQPNKMFEYMSAGLPLIASNFPFWKEIVEENNCGLCVDPYDISSITQAIDYLCMNPIEASQMGKNGLYAVQTKYNWSIEEIKLLDLYQLIINED